MQTLGRFSFLSLFSFRCGLSPLRYAPSHVPRCLRTVTSYCIRLSSAERALPLVYSRKLFIVGICSNGEPEEERQQRKSEAQWTDGRTDRESREECRQRPSSGFDDQRVPNDVEKVLMKKFRRLLLTTRGHTNGMIGTGNNESTGHKIYVT